MEHKLYQVTGFQVMRSYTLEIQFDDGVSQIVNFEGVLEGEFYGPLKDPKLFNGVILDRDLGNLVWPNGADFDPEILHDWPERSAEMIQAATVWRFLSESSLAEDWRRPEEDAAWSYLQRDRRVRRESPHAHGGLSARSEGLQ
jgi:hypothetical protein